MLTLERCHLIACEQCKHGSKHQASDKRLFKERRNAPLLGYHAQGRVEGQVRQDSQDSPGVGAPDVGAKCRKGCCYVEEEV